MVPKTRKVETIYEWLDTTTRNGPEQSCIDLHDVVQHRKRNHWGGAEEAHKISPQLRNGLIDGHDDLVLSC